MCFNPKQVVTTELCITVFQHNSWIVCVNMMSISKCSRHVWWHMATKREISNSKAVISAKRGDHIEDKVQEHPNHGDMHRERYGPSTNPLTCIAVQSVFPSTCSECNSVLWQRDFCYSKPVYMAPPSGWIMCMRKEEKCICQRWNLELKVICNGGLCAIYTVLMALLASPWYCLLLIAYCAVYRLLHRFQLL